MTLLSMGKEIVIGVLTAFLALSNGAASMVEWALGIDSPQEVPYIEEVASPSLFGFEDISNAISTHLKNDDLYQQAQIIATTASATPDVSIEDALANIFCTAKTGGTTRATTGSGVFIDDSGVILTNAHVAQFLLLEGDAQGTETECVIRQGNPAKPLYRAALLYISPSWITKNAHQLYLERPSGTGEKDFALLYVTEALSGELPEYFPALSPLIEDSAFDPDSVQVAGYPAEMLTPEDTRAPLTPRVATTSVTRLFTFSSGKIDLIGIAPTDVGQQGSSGGPIVSDENMVVGLVVTRGNTEREGERSLRALTISYINRTLEEETGLTLSRTLSGDLPLRAHIFAETLAPYLRSLLISQLEE